MSWVSLVGVTSGVSEIDEDEEMVDDKVSTLSIFFLSFFPFSNFFRIP